MIHINDLTVAYDEYIALEGVELNLESGKIHGLLGFNGAGKTTLMNAVFGLVKPAKGIITWNGMAIKKESIAFLPSENFFYPRVTGREYLSIFSKEIARQKITGEFQLPLDKLIEGYSTGMKKKLAFLGIIGLNREVILLDEPFNGLDLYSVMLIKEILKQLQAKGKTILLSSHILETLTDTCFKIHLLSDKKVKRSYDITLFPELKEDIDKEFYSNSNLMNMLE